MSPQIIVLGQNFDLKDEMGEKKEKQAPPHVTLLTSRIFIGNWDVEGCKIVLEMDSRMVDSGP